MTATATDMLRGKAQPNKGVLEDAFPGQGEEAYKISINLWRNKDNTSSSTYQKYLEQSKTFLSTQNPSSGTSASPEQELLTPSHLAQWAFENGIIDLESDPFWTAHSDKVREKAWKQVQDLQAEAAEDARREGLSDQGGSSSATDRTKDLIDTPSSSTGTSSGGFAEWGNNNTEEMVYIQGDSGASFPVTQEVADELIGSGDYTLSEDQGGTTYNPTGDAYLDAMIEIFVPLIEQVYGPDQPPADLSDEDLAYIAQLAEERFGPYYTELERRALEDHNNEILGIETATEREKEDFVVNLKTSTQGLKDNLEDLRVAKNRNQVDRADELRIEERNYQQALEDTREYLANRGTVRGGTRKRAEDRLKIAHEEEVYDIEQQAQRALEDNYRNRQYSIQGFEELFGPDNIPSGLGYVSPYDQSVNAYHGPEVVGSEVLANQRQLADYDIERRDEDIAYGRGTSDLTRDRSADTISYQEELGNKLREDLSQFYQ